MLLTATNKPLRRGGRFRWKCGVRRRGSCAARVVWAMQLPVLTRTRARNEGWGRVPLSRKREHRYRHW